METIQFKWNWQWILNFPISSIDHSMRSLNMVTLIDPITLMHENSIDRLSNRSLEHLFLRVHIHYAYSLLVFIFIGASIPHVYDFFCNESSTESNICVTIFHFSIAMHIAESSRRDFLHFFCHSDWDVAHICNRCESGDYHFLLSRLLECKFNCARPKKRGTFTYINSMNICK